MAIMYTRPQAYPRWAETEAGALDANITEPTSGKKDTGWTDAEEPPAETFNWWQNNAYRWVMHLDDVQIDEQWFFNAADPAKFADNGWTYTATLADTPTIENPSTGALHISTRHRRHLMIGNNNGIGESSLRGLFFGLDGGAAVYGMKCTAAITSFGTATAYSIEIGFHINSDATHRIVIKKKNGSANWWLHVQDATGTSEVDTGVAVTVTHSYDLEIRVITGSVYAYINGVLAASVASSANFPFNDSIRMVFTSTSTAAGTLGYTKIGPVRGWFDEGD